MPPEYKNIGETKKNNLNLLIPVLILLMLFLVGVYFWMGKSVEQPVSQSQITTNEKVEIIKTDLDLASSPEERLPAGFPTNIPVELNGVFESYISDYPDRKITQYAVSYFSDLSKEDKFNEYDTYLKENGFDSGTEVNSMEKGIMHGFRSNENISIFITIQDGRVVVQLGYTKYNLERTR